MRVLGWSRTPRVVPGVEAVALETLLEQADFVTVHVALVPETRGLLDAAALARLRPGAVLVNTARGGLVDEEALAEALRSGRLAAAALDVFAREPLDPASPLLALPNLVLTPHIGSASLATRRRMAEVAVANLAAALAGKRMPHCANPEVYAAG
jgi:glyoxylate reductase